MIVKCVSRDITSKAQPVEVKINIDRSSPNNVQRLPLIFGKIPLAVFVHMYRRAKGRSLLRAKTGLAV